MHCGKHIQGSEYTYTSSPLLSPVTHIAATFTICDVKDPCYLLRECRDDWKTASSGRNIAEILDRGYKKHMPKGTEGSGSDWVIRENVWLEPVNRIVEFSGHNLLSGHLELCFLSAG